MRDLNVENMRYLSYKSAFLYSRLSQGVRANFAVNHNQPQTFRTNRYLSKANELAELNSDVAEKVLCQHHVNLGLQVRVRVSKRSDWKVDCR